MNTIIRGFAVIVLILILSYITQACSVYEGTRETVASVVPATCQVQTTAVRDQLCPGSDQVYTCTNADQTNFDTDRCTGPSGTQDTGNIWCCNRMAPRLSIGQACGFHNGKDLGQCSNDLECFGVCTFECGEKYTQQPSGEYRYQLDTASVDRCAALGGTCGDSLHVGINVCELP